MIKNSKTNALVCADISLTFAADDIKKNWEIYKVAFLKEVQDESKESDK